LPKFTKESEKEWKNHFVQIKCSAAIYKPFGGHFPSILKLDFPDGWPIFIGIMIALVIVLLAGVLVLLLSRFSGSAKPAPHDHNGCCGCGHDHDHSHHADDCSAPKQPATAHDKSV